MAPIESYVWILGLHLAELFVQDQKMWSCWKRRSPGTDFEVLKDWCHSQCVPPDTSCLRGLWVFSCSCHNAFNLPSCPLTLWNCKSIWTFFSELPWTWDLIAATEVTSTSGLVQALKFYLHNWHPMKQMLWINPSEPSPCMASEIKDISLPSFHLSSIRNICVSHCLEGCKILKS